MHGNVFAISPSHVSKALRLPRKTTDGSYEVLRLSRRNHPSQAGHLMLPDSNRSPGISVLTSENICWSFACTAPVTRNAFFADPLSKVPRLPSVVKLRHGQPGNRGRPTVPLQDQPCLLRTMLLTACDLHSDQMSPLALVSLRFNSP